ncbi:hypothetical protein [Nostoc sp. CMAA1605]|uniref:hypothetical protein n=1 Tax=Nostoc sp. CMAA1605 TaxID=2055159 RepID=UPI001F1689AE|nr:hypothetical protein [Nostoc sp. CMAA1605]
MFPNSAIIARVRNKLAISTGGRLLIWCRNTFSCSSSYALPKEVIEGALRIGIGKFTNSLEIEHAAEILSSAVHLTRQAMCSQM